MLAREQHSFSDSIVGTAFASLIKAQQSPQPLAALAGGDKIKTAAVQ
jgi:hypothetical protein